MSFIKIDMETWPRKEHYQYYTTQIKTSYQVNVNLDVTELRQFCKERKLRFYPMMIYYIMKVINEIPAFRMAVNEKGELGYQSMMSATRSIRSSTKMTVPFLISGLITMMTGKNFTGTVCRI